MAKPNQIELTDGTLIPILFENRSVLAIDKPAGWMLVPFTWQKTNRNLHAAIVSSLASGKYWATCRGLKFLNHVHRLDADTTGVLLFAKSRGAHDTISDLFETRRMAKRYLAVVHGVPPAETWSCTLPLSPEPGRIGRVQVDEEEGKDAETHFLRLATRNGRTLVECRPVTGRTHQLRVHLASADLPIVGDELYGPSPYIDLPEPPRRIPAAPLRTSGRPDSIRGRSPRDDRENPSGPPSRTGRDGRTERPGRFGRPERPGKPGAAGPSDEAPANEPAPRPRRRDRDQPLLALRSVDLCYRDPFTRQEVDIHAPFEAFVRQHGFDPAVVKRFKP